MAGKGSGTAIVWGLTFLVAAAIIGVSVYMAVSRQAPPPVSEPPPIPVYDPPQPAPQPQEALEPPPEPAPVLEPDVTVTVPPQAPAPAVDSGLPRLQLDNLAGTIVLDVPFLAARRKMPLDHTCYRQNASPALQWRDAPPGTQSYVVFMEKRRGQDFDAGEPFVNWILFNIPPAFDGLPQGVPRDRELASGARHATSDHDNTGYIGPCEPKGRLTYALRVFALDTVLALEAGVSKHDLIRAMNGHIIDAAEQEFEHYYRL